MRILHRVCYFLFLSWAVIYCGSGNAFGQESDEPHSQPDDALWTQLGLPAPNPDAPYANPPELKLLFEDDFSVDSRDKYEIGGTDGSVVWEEGQIVLKNGAVLALEINANDWFDIEIDLQFAELKTEGQTSELIFRLVLEGATNCQFVLRRERNNGLIRSEIAIVDLLESDLNSKEIEPQIVRQIELDSDLSNGRWQVAYRNGLCRISNLEGSIELYGYLQNGIVAIHKLEVMALSVETALSSLKTSRVVPDEANFAEQNQSGLSHIESLEAKFKQHRDNSEFGKALQIAKELAKEKGKIFGQFHSGFAVSLQNQAEMYYQSGDYTRAALLFRQVASIRESALGKEHPDYATSLNNLALIYVSAQQRQVG